MKKINFIIFNLFLSFVSFGQLTLEHTFETQVVKRIKLEVSGEKYYGYNPISKTVTLYNADFSYWKTIVLNIPEPSISHFEITKICQGVVSNNADVAVIYSYYIGNSTYRHKITLEYGNTLLAAQSSSPNSTGFVLNTITNQPNKIIFGNKVYSYPGLTLENTFVSNVYRINLEISGPKYYVYDLSSNHIQIYNTDFTLWKSIYVPLPSTTYPNYILYSNVKDISETTVNDDSLIEFVHNYCIASHTSAGRSYSRKILNEEQAVLNTYSISGSYPPSSISFSKLEGQPTKMLLTGYNHGNGQYYYQFYSLPSFAFEDGYSNFFSRKNFGLSGEKYCYREGNILKIKNSDHTLWKSIPMNIPSGATFISLNDISQNILNDNEEIEFSYTIRKSINNGTNTIQVYESIFMDESGNTILSVPHAKNLYISQLPEEQDKVIADLVFESQISTVPSWQKGNIYDIDSTLGTDNLEYVNSIKIYPVPVNDFLNISSSSSTIVEVNFFTIDSKLIKTIKDVNIKIANTESLNNGIYIIELIDENNLKSLHKIIVNH